MIRAKLRAALDRLRTAVESSRKAVVAVGGVLLVEVGGRIGLPGLNTQVLSDFLLHRGGGGLLSVYDWLVGGALTRGAVLALGAIPYLSARLYVWLAKEAVPTIAKLDADERGRTKLRRGTRVLTVVVALVQSYGFAKFVQTIPGAVTRPGIGFVVQTMATLTAGAIVAMVLAEQITKQLGRETKDDGVVNKDASESRAVSAGDVPLLPAGSLEPVIDVPRAREKVNVPR